MSHHPSRGVARGLSLALLAAVAACDSQAATHNGSPEGHYSAAEVRVIDGDTIKIGRQRVRLLNIDAPEMAPHSKCWAEAALAREARDYVVDAISAHGASVVDLHGYDRYGRTLARIEVNGQDLGEALVRRGLAARWIGHRWHWCEAGDYGDHDGPRIPLGRRSRLSWGDVSRPAG